MGFYLYAEMLDKYYVIAKTDEKKYSLLAWENIYCDDDPEVILTGSFGDCNEYINSKR